MLISHWGPNLAVSMKHNTHAAWYHIYWFNFDALAQGNAYKPTKEPTNYHGPGGDWTHDLQTEATSPVASCPARSLHAAEIVSKNTIPMTSPRLYWTTDNPSGMHRCQFQHLCVLILNCTQALAIYIFVGLILMLRHREMWTDKLSWTRRGSNSRPLDYLSLFTVTSATWWLNSIFSSKASATAMLTFGNQY